LSNIFDLYAPKYHEIFTKDHFWAINVPSACEITRNSHHMIELFLLLAQQPTPSPQCHRSYSECLPVVDDLNCSDIKAKNFRVLDGNDPYQLDSDSDSVACEKGDQDAKKSAFVNHKSQQDFR